MPKVSVIIPVYGVEKYIERCVRSLFEQSLDSMEFIFVDDCTLDNSINILCNLVREYESRLAKSHKIVRIEKMPVNSGLPSVRKFGLQFCTGDYVVHCDSDDWVEKDMYKLMYEAAIQYSVDIVVCDYLHTDGDLYNRRFRGCYTPHIREFLYETLEGKVGWIVWNKLVKRSLYDNKIIDPLKSNGEDLALISQLLFYAKSIVYINKPLYNYFCNDKSITRMSSKDAAIKRFLDARENLNILDDFFEARQLFDDRYETALVNLKFKQKQFLYLYLNDPEVQRIWKIHYPELSTKVWYNSLIKVKDKLKFYLVIARYRLF